MLPLVPADRLAATPIVDIHYDAGETVGWPRFAATVAASGPSLPAGERVAVLTGNYGEAGAVDRFLPDARPGAQRAQRLLGLGPAAGRRRAR